MLIESLCLGSRVKVGVKKNICTVVLSVPNSVSRFLLNFYNSKTIPLNLLFGKVLESTQIKLQNVP